MMKLQTLIFALLMVVLAIPATLYFVHPKVVVETTIIEKIPDEISIGFGPAKPDTVLDLGRNMLSKKTFRQHLLGLDVISSIDVWAICPADSIANQIVLAPDKEELTKILQEEIDREVSRGYSKGLKSGLLIGGGAVALVGGAIAIVAGGK